MEKKIRAYWVIIEDWITTIDADSHNQAKQRAAWKFMEETGATQPHDYYTSIASASLDKSRGRKYRLADFFGEGG